jgi:hypothetical protein
VQVIDPTHWGEPSDIFLVKQFVVVPSATDWVDTYAPGQPVVIAAGPDEAAEEGIIGQRAILTSDGNGRWLVSGFSSVRPLVFFLPESVEESFEPQFKV